MLFGLVPMIYALLAQPNDKDHIIGLGFLVLAGFLVCCVSNVIGILLSVPLLPDNLRSAKVARLFLLLNVLMLLAGIAIFFFPFVRNSR